MIFVHANCPNPEDSINHSTNMICTKRRNNDEYAVFQCLRYETTIKVYI